MRALIEELVRAVEAAWLAHDRDPAAFPDIATEALERARAHERVEIEDVLAWLGEAELPEQDLASGFGEPPLTLHADGRWAIQLLTWTDGRTSIHEHDFAGAFAVVVGSSIQRRYAFDAESPERSPLRLGALTVHDVALLERGAISPIHPGDRLIHSVFHLERPTLSLVIRTEGGLLDGPQYDYWAPFVALDPEHIDGRAVRQVQMLGALVRAGGGWEAYATALLERSSLHHAFRVLDLLLAAHGGADLSPAVLDAAVGRHGARAVERVLATLRHGRWESGIMLQRSAVSSDEHRFFLAALLNGGAREAVLDLVAARHPGGDPLGIVHRWIGELFAPGVAEIGAHAAAELMDGRTVTEVADGLRARYGARLALSIGEPLAFCTTLSEGVLRPLFTPR